MGMITVQINSLSFTYPGVDGNPPPRSKPLIQGMSLTLHAGDRCLLVGANGAGKTTLLKVIGGKHIVHPDMVRVLGRSAFHDTALTASGDLSYLGGEWRRDVAFAGFDVPMQMDISAQKMIFGVQNVSPQRRNRLIKVLDVDLKWRMHKVSDGQRRRVQICMGLLRPFKVLLLDEITVDLDIVTRADLLSFLSSECVEGATIIYATHIFDGLETWPSHIAHVANGKLHFFKSINDVEEIKEMSLMRTVEKWLRKQVEQERKLRKGRAVNGEHGKAGPSIENPSRALQPLNNGWAGGRLHSTLAGEDLFELTSNKVLRL